MTANLVHAKMEPHVLMVLHLILVIAVMDSEEMIAKHVCKAKYKKT